MKKTLGGALTCLISTVNCGFCNASFGLCCGCKKNLKSSMATRLSYFFIFLIGFILCTVVILFGLNKPIQHFIPFSCFDTEEGHIHSLKLTCNAISNYNIIYRISFASFIFFFIMSLLMVRVTSSETVRGQLHNGHWLMKFLIYVGFIIFAMFYIPETYFIWALNIFGRMCSFVFIFMELVLLIDFIYTINGFILAKYNRSKSGFYYYGMVVTTASCYLLSITSFIMMTYFFGRHETCHQTRFVVIFNFLWIIALSIVSIHQKVQKYTPRSGLFQGSIMTLFLMVLTFDAIASHTDVTCNPLHNYFFYGKQKTSHVDVTTTMVSQSHGFNASDYSMDDSLIEGQKLKFTPHGLLMLIFYFILIIFFCVRQANSPFDIYDENLDALREQILRNGPASNLQASYGISEQTISAHGQYIPNELSKSEVSQDRSKFTLTVINNNADSIAKKSNKISRCWNGKFIKAHTATSIKNEQYIVTYDYSLFHFIFGLASMFTMMIFTNWTEYDINNKILKHATNTIWIKSATVWISATLYIWTLIAPIIFPNRDFNN